MFVNMSNIDTVDHVKKLVLVIDTRKQEYYNKEHNKEVKSQPIKIGNF